MTLPFAIIPLIWLTSRRDVMGNMVNGPTIRDACDRWSPASCWR